MLRGLDQQMKKKEDGGMYFMDRIWVPLIGDVRKMIMDEAHTTRYYIHPGADKMYHDLRDMYWWLGMKRDIATYGFREEMRIFLPELIFSFPGSWDIHLSLDDFSYNNSYHSSIRCAPFEALYGRRCRSPVLWVEIRERGKVMI
ncbi:putative reverse transcriptase domain-containing protein [Tanacetum coccineum]|uniref:Reverse transcriptase domain-containing protein n=1 Tax=Tanacetum coccineum TaxID=301880 RepID=A0ABQ5I843_9ASTR